MIAGTPEIQPFQQLILGLFVVVCKLYLFRKIFPKGIPFFFLGEISISFKEWITYTVCHQH